jgi:hypothetical protein
MGKWGLDSPRYEHAPLVDSCEHGDREPAGMPTIKDGTFLDQLSDYHLSITRLCFKSQLDIH